MQMDVKLLETFRAVMETQSMTGAARLLGLTQPGVSAQIARLEAQVGFALFERVGGRLKASDEGRRFHAEVRDALGMIERLAEAAENIRAGVAESVTVASHPSASISLMPGVVSELLRARPGARLRMVNRTSEEVRALFEAGVADLAIAELPIHIPGVELRRHTMPCVAILPADHPLAARESVTVKDMSGLPFVAMPDTRVIGHRIRAAFDEGGAAYAPVAESEYFSAICCLVTAGCGVSIVDPLSAATFSANGLAVRPVQPEIGYDIGVFRRASARPAQIVDEVIALIETRLAAAGARRTGTTRTDGGRTP